MFGRLLFGLAITSGTLIGTVVLLARRREPVHSPPDCGCGKTSTGSTTASARDYFHITRSRGTSPAQKWVLQGFGRYQCFLLFDSWREAMDQATFHMESLHSPKKELIAIEW